MPFPGGSNFAAEYHPQGGFGGFHARYIPGTGVFTITARIKLTWQGDDGPWDPLKQNTFQQKLLAKVPAGWDHKWRFRCTANGFNNVMADPVFNLNVVANNEHFNFICHNQHGQAYLHAGNNSVHLFEHDVRSIDHNPTGVKNVGMSSGGVMQAERRKVEQILIPVQNITVSRAAGPWTVDAGSVMALTTFAQNLARVDPYAPMYPLTIEATSGLADKARDMVDCVYNFLTAHGVTNYPLNRNPVKSRRKWKNVFTHTPKPTGTVAISLSDDDTSVRADWVYRYKVAVHEFGHCMGLPDEYQDHYPALGTQAHDEWRRLCTAAGVQSRPVPKFDASIMSCGWQTFPCHFVTLWDALAQLTHNHVQPGDWVIERGTQADTL